MIWLHRCAGWQTGVKSLGTLVQEGKATTKLKRICRVHHKLTYPKSLFFVWGLRRTNTVKVKWRLTSFTGGRIPRVPLRALLQYFRHRRVHTTSSNEMKECKVPGVIRTQQRLGASDSRSTTLTIRPNASQLKYRCAIFVPKCTVIRNEALVFT